MCRYCQAIVSEKMDASGHMYRDLLPTSYSSNDFNEEEVERMSNIIPPSPISKRIHAEDGLTSLIEIYVADDHRRVHHVYIPIRYCPMCGRDLSDD